MKNFLFMAMVIVIAQACSSGKSILELTPDQSMLITGKGEGQDAAINPYQDVKSVALVKNLEGSGFNVRIQNQGRVIDIVEVPLHETKRFTLEKGDELYLDTEVQAKAKVTFRRF